MIFYWQGASSHSWSSKLNWSTTAYPVFTVLTGSLPNVGDSCTEWNGTPTNVPHIDIGVNLGSGICDIPNIIITSGFISSGTWTGANLNNGGYIAGGIFSGNGIQNSNEIDNGVFTGDILNFGVIYNGIFFVSNFYNSGGMLSGFISAASFINDASGEIYGGVYTSNFLDQSGGGLISGGEWFKSGNLLVGVYSFVGLGGSNPGFLYELKVDPSVYTFISGVVSAPNVLNGIPRYTGGSNGTYVVIDPAGYSTLASNYGPSSSLSGTLASSKIHDATYGTLADGSVLVAAGGTYIDPSNSDVWHGVSIGVPPRVGTKVGSSIPNLTTANLAYGVTVDDVGPGIFTHTADYELKTDFTDPGKNNVLTGNNYLYQGVNQVASLTLPSASDVWHTASQYGVGGIGSTPSKVGSSIPNLISGNVANGVMIDDVTGIFEGGIDPSMIVDPFFVLVGHYNYIGGQLGRLTLPNTDGFTTDPSLVSSSAHFGPGNAIRGTAGDELGENTSQSDSWSTTDVDNLIVPKNIYRDKLVIQMRSDDPCTLAFDELAEFDKGIQLLSTERKILIKGALSRCAVHAICATNKTASGGYQENLGIC